MSQDEGYGTPRYEVKFNARGSHYSDILHWLSLDLATYHRPYPPRVVNNIYFDSPDLAAFQENISGVSSRAKLRLRWYGDSIGPKNITLELKIKRNRYGWKRQQSFALANSLDQYSFRELTAELRSKAGPNMALLLGLNPCPVLLNRYSRDYFISGDEYVRATVDKDLQFNDLRSSDGLGDAKRVVGPEICVVEFKSSVEDLSNLEKAVARFRYPKTRNSKYAIGVMASLGY